MSGHYSHYITSQNMKNFSFLVFSGEYKTGTLAKNGSIRNGHLKVDVDQQVRQLPSVNKNGRVKRDPRHKKVAFIKIF